MEHKNAIEFRNVSKRFGEVVANDRGVVFESFEFEDLIVVQRTVRRRNLQPVPIDVKFLLRHGSSAFPSRAAKGAGEDSL